MGVEKKDLPRHLQKYVVPQGSKQYTPVEHATWRYILHQLRKFLSAHAHPSYGPGLQLTGISLEEIPSIESVSSHLEKFGWRAIPVSGFIPPAAFMELQALNVLPIACEMRTLEHLLYTPAPDIVHEAAGHAPMLANNEYAQYLREYAQVSRNALHSSQDYELYEAIRELSDLKELPSATPEQIAAAEKRLLHLQASSRQTSEATFLARMNWWTAEYGLYGDVKNPLIYGAGLLSSLGESKWCLRSKVKKIPLTLDCIHTGYDITEPQPQLFVTPSFSHLSEVLEKLAGQMSFQIGGLEGLRRAQDSKSICTVELNSGLQISGILNNVQSTKEKCSYLQFSGPCQLAGQRNELQGHGVSAHPEGFGTPVGRLRNRPEKCISEFSSEDMKRAGLVRGKNVHLETEHGITIAGVFTGDLQRKNRIQVLSFENCTVKSLETGKILFQPAWGRFDMAVGDHITSVFGGWADSSRIENADSFHAHAIPARTYTAEEKEKFAAYSSLRSCRAGKPVQPHILRAQGKWMLEKHPNDWLFFLEAYDLTHFDPILRQQFLARLKELQGVNPHYQSLIDEGLSLIA